MCLYFCCNAAVVNSFHFSGTFVKKFFFISIFVLVHLAFDLSLVITQQNQRRHHRKYFQLHPAVLINFPSVLTFSDKRYWTKYPFLSCSYYFIVYIFILTHNQYPRFVFCCWTVYKTLRINDKNECFFRICVCVYVFPLEEKQVLWVRMLNIQVWNE